MTNVTNLDRAMWAETTLQDYSENKEGTRETGLYDDACSVASDLIADICHLLHLDEKSAGCMPPDDIRALLDSAFANFEAETENDE